MFRWAVMNGLFLGLVWAAIDGSPIAIVMLTVTVIVMAIPTGLFALGMMWVQHKADQGYEDAQNAWNKIAAMRKARDRSVSFQIVDHTYDVFIIGLMVWAGWGVLATTYAITMAVIWATDNTIGKQYEWS